MWLGKPGRDGHDETDFGSDLPYSLAMRCFPDLSVMYKGSMRRVSLERGFNHD